MQRTCRPRARAREVLADRARRVPPDPGVDLVEHEHGAPLASRCPRGREPRSAAASITRESSPPEAISRSGPAGMPAFGAIVQLDRVGAARARSRPGAGRSTRERGIGHRQLGQPLARPPAASCRRRRDASLAELGGTACRARSRAAASSASSALERVVGVLKLVEASAAALGVAQHVGDRAAVLALQPREQRRAAPRPPRAARARPRRSSRSSGAAHRRRPRPRSAAPPAARASGASATVDRRPPARAARPPPASSPRGAAARVGGDRLARPPAAAARSPSRWRSRSRSALSSACSSSLGAAASISSSSNAQQVELAIAGAGQARELLERGARARARARGRPRTLLAQRRAAAGPQ